MMVQGEGELSAREKLEAENWYQNDRKVAALALKMRTTAATGQRFLPHQPFRYHPSFGGGGMMRNNYHHHLFPQMGQSHSTAGYKKSDITLNDFI
jgi:hypothetical protein